MNVYVYRNLTTGLWQYGQKPKSVKANPQRAEIVLRNVTFRVMAGGYNFTQKQLAETGKRHRLVHAFACGEMVESAPPAGERRQISYNPFKGDFFYDAESGERVERCDYVHFTADQKAYAITTTKEND